MDSSDEGSFEENPDLTFGTTCTEWNSVITTGFWDLLTVTFGAENDVLSINMYKGDALMCSSTSPYPEGYKPLVVSSRGDRHVQKEPTKAMKRVRKVWR